MYAEPASGGLSPIDLERKRDELVSNFVQERENFLDESMPEVRLSCPSRHCQTFHCLQNLYLEMP